MIRLGRLGDLEHIAEIQSLSPEAAHWPAAEYLAHSLVVAEHQGKLAGFAVWRSLGDGEWELLNIAVHPAQRGAGIGHALLAALPAGRIFLEVRESNLAARRLYERSGFTLLGRRHRYYQSPAEDGIVMELQK